VTEKLSWYVARSSGLIAWALVTASIIWGLALSGRLVRRRGVPAWLLALHRYLGTLSVIFVVVHLLALVADNYVYFGWAEMFVPFATDWRPVPTAWGIAAFYLLVAIQMTSWLMRRMPRKVWHTIHCSSFALFVTGTVHGFQSGADRPNRLVQWSALVGITLVVTLVLFRVFTLSERRHRRRSRQGNTAANSKAVVASAAD
jgi:DMSO/TMAO reductase YedYZ heme-binding membrane subunit